jgi:hypothetical protein
MDEKDSTMYVLAPFPRSEGRRDEIGIEGFLEAHVHLIIQPGSSCCAIHDLYSLPTYKASLRRLAILPVGKISRMLQRPGDCAVIVVVSIPIRKIMVSLLTGFSCTVVAYHRSASVIRYVPGECYAITRKKD